MIAGIGCDVVAHARIQRLVNKFGQKFAEKILAPVELACWQQQARPVNYLAKRFAAKEAFAKALGTGFRDGLSLKHIAVVNNDLGAPVFQLSGVAKAVIEQRQIQQTLLSISDEREMSLAFVILN